jgi:hypothetical protein
VQQLRGESEKKPEHEILKPADSLSLTNHPYVPKTSQAGKIPRYILKQGLHDSTATGTSSEMLD